MHFVLCIYKFRLFWSRPGNGKRTMWETLCIFAREVFEFSVLVQGVQKLDQLKRFISKTLSFYQTYQENIMLIIFFNARVDLSSQSLMIPNIFQKCLWRGSPQFCHYSILSFQLPRCTLHATQHVKHFAIYLKYLWWKASIY